MFKAADNNSLCNIQIPIRTAFPVPSQSAYVSVSQGVEWQSKNIERVRAYKATNKAKRRSTTDTGISGAALLAWKNAQPKRCYWCGGKCSRNYHVDHYIPLSRGGKHEVSNLVIACQTCNLRKHAKDPLDFAKEVGRLL